MEGEVEVIEEDKGEVLVLRIKGRLDAVSSPVTEKKVSDIIDDGKLKIAMDFAGVDYLSSAGMRMLLATTKKLKTLSGQLVVCAVKDNVMDVLKMSGFDHVLQLAQSEEEALQQLS